MAAPYWDVNVKSTSDANTALRHPKTNPLEVRRGIRPGMVKGIDITFPPGCAGLVGVQVYHREHILAPSDKGEWVHGDNRTAHWETGWPIVGAGNYIGIVVYNNDDTYEHTISVGMSHVPLEILPKTDVILGEILMLIYEIKSAVMAIPNAIQSVIHSITSIKFWR